MLMMGFEMKMKIALFLGVVSMVAPSGGMAWAQEGATSSAAATDEMAVMRARLEVLEARLAATVAAKAPPAPKWKGAPQLSSSDGWSFKPRGRLQYDVASVTAPASINDPGLGVSNELRRARLGVEGDMPGGFGYKFELDFADNEVEITDALLVYKAGEAVELVVGQHNGFQSLEELTSSRFTSFMERAAFTDAFNFERRVGISARYARGDIQLSAGIFTDNISDLTGSGGGLGDENSSVGGDARLVYMPKLGSAQLHLGLSAHYRDMGGIAASGTTTRYRQRPFIHTSDTRFLATPALAVSDETHYGVEAALIHGPVHAVAEAHWFEPGMTGAGAEPAFFGGYAEIGYFLTGETRGYKKGVFDRTKVLRPLGKGGPGAFQVNVRYDRVDLNSGVIRGGRQNGYQASLVWIPQDHVRLLLNYAHLKYDNAAIPAAGGDRSYSVNVVAARAQIDF